MKENRQEYNKQILDIFYKVTEKFPSMRFHQLLSLLDIIVDDVNGDIIDDYHTESKAVLDRVVKAIGKYNIEV